MVGDTFRAAGRDNGPVSELPPPSHPPHVANAVMSTPPKRMYRIFIVFS